MLEPSSNPVYPTGLVTVLGGTVVNNGATTVYETKVIGTYIDGKYAQILKSTSSIKSHQSLSSINTPESIKIEATKSITMPFLKASEQVKTVISNRFNNNNRFNSAFGRQESHLRGESSIQNTRRVRPVRVLDSNNNSNNNNNKGEPTTSSLSSSESGDKARIESPFNPATRRFKLRQDARVS